MFNIKRRLSHAAGLLPPRASAYRGAMVLRPALAPILMLPLLIAGCSAMRDGAPTSYPALLPQEQILGTPSTATDPGPWLAAQRAALQRRAAELRLQN